MTTRIREFLKHRTENGPCLVVDLDIVRENYLNFAKVLPDTAGEEAVAIYAQHQQEIALVVTDMMMPVMDGAALIRILTRINPEVKILAASGLTSNHTVNKSGGAGAQHFLTKPYTAETLLRAMRVLLDAV